MDQFPMDSINSARTLVAVSAANEVLKAHMRREGQAKTDRQNAPIVAGMNEMISELQHQNKILSSQVELLKEENERQRKQVEEDKAAEEKASRQAQTANIISWIMSGVAIVVSVVAIVIPYTIK